MRKATYTKLLCTLLCLLCTVTCLFGCSGIDTDNGTSQGTEQATAVTGNTDTTTLSDSRDNPSTGTFALTSTGIEIPAYSGDAYVVLLNNEPLITSDDRTTTSFEPNRKQRKRWI